jgi:hypothetical protein
MRAGPGQNQNLLPYAKQTFFPILHEVISMERPPRGRFADRRKYWFYIANFEQNKVFGS